VPRRSSTALQTVESVSRRNSTHAEVSMTIMWPD
jgi:hypothetical protein